jgi:hypothetical protein
MYKLSPLAWDETEYSSVIDLNRMCAIPFDPANQDFVQYQKWLSEGNQPLPADEPNA